jgi:hypothetical protein
MLMRIEKTLWFSNAFPEGNIQWLSKQLIGAADKCPYMRLLQMG